MTEPIRMIALTGGPGGGKSTLLRDLREHPVLGGRLFVKEESIHPISCGSCGSHP